MGGNLEITLSDPLFNKQFGKSFLSGSGLKKSSSSFWTSSGESLWIGCEGVTLSASCVDESEELCVERLMPGALFGEDMFKNAQMQDPPPANNNEADLAKKLI